jgi:voltage-gated potassium channel
MATVSPQVEHEGFLSESRFLPGEGRLRRRLFSVIFKADTPAGKAFDIALIAAIGVSVLAVMLSTVENFNARYGRTLYYLEWGFTIVFTIEYLLRLYCVRDVRIYAGSFYGIVDLLSVLPTYLALFVTGAGYMLIIRALRILRLFRVLKLSRYIGEANTLIEALAASWRKILVFIYAVLTLVVIFGAVMFFIEGEEAGFTSIPRSVYWTIVTLTTVGYGDIAPQTPLGQGMASVIMILGYGIIAVPTGIYASELTQAIQRRRSLRVCPACQLVGHETDASYCKRCGASLAG